eukprot:XP_001707540.1 Hypothetical protein GL50803_88956 [Giardia lamblia ATCC 50803]
MLHQIANSCIREALGKGDRRWELCHAPLFLLSILLDNLVERRLLRKGHAVVDLMSRGIVVVCKARYVYIRIVCVIVGLQKHFGSVHYGIKGRVIVEHAPLPVRGVRDGTGALAVARIIGETGGKSCKPNHKDLGGYCFREGSSGSPRQVVKPLLELSH